jgi:hypothetical protein
VARPRSNPEAVALGVELLEAGDRAAAVKRSGLSLRTLQRARAAAPSPARRGAVARRPGPGAGPSPAPLPFAAWAPSWAAEACGGRLVLAAFDAEAGDVARRTPPGDPARLAPGLADLAQACADPGELVELVLLAVDEDLADAAALLELAAEELRRRSAPASS